MATLSQPSRPKRASAAQATIKIAQQYASPYDDGDLQASTLASQDAIAVSSSTKENSSAAGKKRAVKEDQTAPSKKSKTEQAPSALALLPSPASVWHPGYGWDYSTLTAFYTPPPNPKWNKAPQKHR